ncbi:30S ribosome-binding factor RbfA [Cupriavidus oxalaticus]|jgi:ribosome-binding factor A|uniref:Ribosome-binding factor A n=1 Tax=Cupriavidus oxalaticus TaxID=96344 RepID=A0A375FX30_9BURK|nr:30S ribosome-binding factor RbfA [Cupriavidus oxalaticus]QEZ47012.1 30S ribosome-binding factor RbfA [Cupriavidus oxalaticus]QRQ88680.1 30S ribosome-binding factor RbfA [Cupriavidus oxalaticus]QRQ92994.1 30S ribosome-binding factor RbfA [Cupriavidus oxalaticus]WQD81604.1 30S ribosome-binding factor RbfA [Cupriavidus oxalaticus]SPC12933.1 Ribosome-binding factor A [Cupriavidus oxalaticus]
MAKKGNISSRNLRISDQIQKDLAEMIQRELRDPRLGLVTLQSVTLTPDYAHAKVHFTVLGAEPATVEAILNEKAGFLHSLLYKRLHIHTVPTLRFLHDTSVEHAIEMSKLINEANATRSKDD